MVNGGNAFGGGAAEGETGGCFGKEGDASQTIVPITWPVAPIRGEQSSAVRFA